MNTDSDSELTVEPRRGGAACAPRRVAIVGAGRLGAALAAALREAGLDVAGPLRRDDPFPGDADAALLCVPDAEIAAAADALPGTARACSPGIARRPRHLVRSQAATRSRCIP